MFILLFVSFYDLSLYTYSMGHVFIQNDKICTLNMTDRWEEIYHHKVTMFIRILFLTETFTRY